MSGTVTGLTSSTFDPHKAEAFAGRLLTAFNDGALCLMISIGHRIGLLDAMRDRPPQTSQEIASRAGLDERYVREWLGAMVTSRSNYWTGSVSILAEVRRTRPLSGRLDLCHDACASAFVMMRALLRTATPTRRP